ncbi:MAG TPA: AI-2E family transporter [Candidatus Saccharimonadales bacterium]|nr:AI-2E family transporter [Candidatus Saccharimonadales bacterium]
MTASSGSSGAALRWAAAALAGVALLWLWRETLTLLALALLLAYLLRPAVELAARRLPRAAAAGLVMGLFLLLLAGAAAWFVPLLVAQGTEFGRELPRMSAQVLAQLRSLQAGLLARIPDAWGPAVEAQLSRLLSQSGAFLSARLVRLLGTLPQLLALAVVPVLAFYLLEDGRGMAAWLLGWVPERRRDAWWRYLGAADRALAGYVRGQAVVCLVQAVMVTAVLTLLGFPFAFVLGPLAGLAEVVPFLGAAVVDILLVVIGLSRGGWMWAWGLGAYVLLNQVTSYLVTPRVMGRTLRVHPLAVLASLAAGAEAGGFMGMVFALPLIAVIAAVLHTSRDDRAAAAAAAMASATSGGTTPRAAGVTSPAP